MSNFSEDKIWKNINNKDANILLEILDIDTVKVKIWTKELRLFDPKDYVPDIILELDYENLIIELQSTRVDEEFSKRALTYVAVANREKENKKEMNLMVLSTAEKSKTIRYNFTENSVFVYRIVNLRDLDYVEIMEVVESKIKNGLKIEAKELVLYALVPIIKGENMEKYIKRVVHNLLQVENVSESIKNLSYGIEWLIVDKFVKDQEFRNVLCDSLGDRMSLIFEYGDRREQKGRDSGLEDGRKEGIKETLLSFVNSGTSLSEISQITGKSISELEDILYDSDE